MARPGLEPGTPRFSVLRPNLSNWAESPAIKRLLVGSRKEAEAGYLRTFALQLGTQIGFGTQSTPMAATSPVDADAVCDSTGSPAASCSAPVKHDVGGLSERRASHVRARGWQSHPAQGGALRRLASAPAARPFRASRGPDRDASLRQTPEVPVIAHNLDTLASASEGSRRAAFVNATFLRPWRVLLKGRVPRTPVQGARKPGVAGAARGRWSRSRCGRRRRPRRPGLAASTCRSPVRPTGSRFRSG
jgi:hypothetical protein